MPTEKAAGQKMYVALVVILLRSLPPSHQQLAEQSIYAGELTLARTNIRYNNHHQARTNHFTEVVAKDFALDAKRRLATLIKEVAPCSTRVQGSTVS